MNKTERMYALVEELRSVAPRVRSVRWLAGRFEVSTRTIERDLAALQRAGVPVWAESGRRGGYALDAQMTLPPLNFTASEAAAVALALAVAGASPFGESARSGLRKIITGMSPAARRGAADLIGRIRVPDRADPVLAGAAASAVAGVVARAVAEQRVLEIDYVDKAGATSTRRPVEPLGLLGQGAHWYLIAWCRLRAGHRAFRLDRIQAAAMRMESAPPRDLPDFRCEPAIRVRQLAIEP